MDNKKTNNPLWRKVVFFVPDAIKEILNVQKNKAEIVKIQNIAVELDSNTTPQEYKENLKRQGKITYQTLKTIKEKIAFFFDYFVETKTQQLAFRLAYTTVYLLENTSIAEDNDPFDIADRLASADCKILLEKLLNVNFDAYPEKHCGWFPYQELIMPIDGEPYSDEYKQQCLYLAAFYRLSGETSPYEVGRWPYRLDIKKKIESIDT